MKTNNETYKNKQINKKEGKCEKLFVYPTSIK